MWGKRNDEESRKYMTRSQLRVCVEKLKAMVFGKIEKKFMEMVWYETRSLGMMTREKWGDGKKQDKIKVRHILGGCQD